ncbi:MAG: sensor histidine kinase, partial [Thermoanaerobaculia bacterium]
SGLASLPVGLGLMILGALSSNIALFWVPARHFESTRFIAGVMIADTAGITAAILLSGNGSAEFFFVYFFVLFLATIGENLGQIALGAAVAAVGYLFAVSRGEVASLWSTAILIRLPFLLMVATFYGYLVSRLRREQRRARQEALFVERLKADKADISEEARRLELASQRLEREVAERREAEHELERANRKLKDLSDRKSDFISAVSHELRTPLTSIRNALDLMTAGRAGSLNTKQERFIGIAIRNASRLTHIINDLLDLSKIEAGKLAFRFEETQITGLLEAVGQSFGAQSKPDAPTLELKCDSDMPSVWIDPHRIEQVIANLLSNAFKFTPAKGRITLSARAADGGVEIRVTDTGVGLSPEEQERVFDRFYQVQDPLTRQVQGSGLGLSIVRRMLAGHGSTIAVESEPGEGSAFFFTLPAFSPAAAEHCAFEEAFQEIRGQSHFFSLLLIQACPTGEDSTEALGRLKELIRASLPRSSDEVFAQEVAQRVVVLLPGTSKDGAGVVRRRLHGVLAEHADKNGRVPAEIHGPVSFPEDGSSAKQLLSGLQSST